MSQDTITIYHNPRCGTSRSAMKLLEEKGVAPRVIHYLETPPDGDQIKTLLGKLKIRARELIRTRETLYTELKLDDPAHSEEHIIKTLAANPILIQRPIIVKGERAVIARPAETLLEII